MRKCRYANYIRLYCLSKWDMAEGEVFFKA